MFTAQFSIDTQVSVTISSQTMGVEVLTGPMKMANAWGVTIEIGTRPRPTFFPWHRVYKIEKA